MTYQYYQGKSRNRIVWLGVGVVAAMALAFPWVTERLGYKPTTLETGSDTIQKLYNSALDTGWQAAVAVQTAQTRQEWESVADQWDQAISLIQTVKQEVGDADGVLAQKQTEYEQYRNYALQKSDQHPLDYNWEIVTELAGDKSYILVDPDTADAELAGPPLQMGADHVPQNVDYINTVLASVGLPAIASQSSFQVLNDNQYRVATYPAGELVLHRTLCSQSFVIADKYDCLWKITLRRP
jgi:hypothetical protein